MKKNSRLETAKLNHQKFLKKMGCAPEDIQRKKPKTGIYEFPNYKTKTKYKSLITNDPVKLPKKDLETKLKITNDPGYDGFLKKKSMVSPAYNKGGLQYFTEKK